MEDALFLLKGKFKEGSSRFLPSNEEADSLRISLTKEMTSTD